MLFNNIIRMLEDFRLMIRLTVFWLLETLAAHREKGENRIPSCLLKDVRP